MQNIFLLRVLAKTGEIKYSFRIVQPAPLGGKLTNRLYIGLSSILLLFFIVFQVRYHFFTLDHISWINVFDGDISYQVDRLLLNAHFPNHDQTSSIDIDYGSELFLLAPLLKFVNLIFGNNPLNSYYVITAVHLICGMSSLIFLSNLFGKHLFEKSLWLTVVLFSPLFGFYIGYIKPDANVVLLMISMSLYFCSKLKQDARNIVPAIAAAAFGFAIKWWSLFCLLPITYYLLGKKIKIDESLVKNAKRFLWSSILIMLPISHYIINEILYTLQKNNIHNFLTTTSPIFLKLALFIFAVIVFSISYFLLKLSAKSLKKSNQVFATFLYLAISFTSFYLIFGLPYIICGFFIKSNHYFAVGTLQVDQLGSSSRRSILENIQYWISESNLYNYLSPALLLTMLAVVIAFILKKRSLKLLEIDFKMESIVFFLGGFTLFIFLILNRNNRAMIGMLYPLYLLLFYYLFTYFKNSKQKIILLTIVSILQIIYQANGQAGKLSKMYFERDSLRSNVIEANKWLEANFPHLKSFRMCDYQFPQTSSSPFTFHYYWRYRCKTNLENDLKSLAMGDGWIISSEAFDKFIIDHPEILKTKKVTKYSTFFVYDEHHLAIIENVK